MKKRLIVIGAALAAALALRGCGGGENNLAAPQPDAGSFQQSGTAQECAGSVCGSNQVCNELKVCINRPTVDAVAGAADGPGGHAPDVSCYNRPPAATGGPDKTVVTGCVDSFGPPANTSGLEVSFYPDGALETPVAGPSAALQTPTCASAGAYEVLNVPTNALLVRKVGCAAGTACGFVDAWEFNVFFDAAAAAGGSYAAPQNAETVAIAVGDSAWRTLPRDAGLAGGVQPGHGAILGRVSDCGGAPVMNAAIGMSVAPRRLAYFDADRTLTNADGLYAGFDLLTAVPGVVVSALLQVDGTLQSMGTFKVPVFPGAVSAMSFKGGRPVAQQ